MQRTEEKKSLVWGLHQQQTTPPPRTLFHFALPPRAAGKDVAVYYKLRFSSSFFFVFFMVSHCFRVKQLIFRDFPRAPFFFLDVFFFKDHSLPGPFPGLMSWLG